MQIGGTTDTLALTAIGSALLSTSPYFSSFPPMASLSAGLLGASWLCTRYLKSQPQIPIFDTRLNISSAKNLTKKKGLLLGYSTTTGDPIYLPPDTSNLHGLVQGGSGQGKTVFLRSLAFQQIQRGGGLFFIDAKMDRGDLDTIYQYAQWCGRAQDLWVINPGEPELSHSYNSILYGDPDENADSVLSLIPASEDKPGPDHYRQSAKQALTTIFAALKACGLAYNFMDISILIQNQRALSELEQRLIRQIPNHYATKNFSLFLEQFKGGSGNREQDAHINVKRLKEMLGGIGSRMHTFGSGGFGKVANSYSPEVKLYQGMRENKIIVLRLPTMGKADTAYSFAKMALADFRVALSWLQKLPEHERPNPPFMGLFDEFGSYATNAMAQPLEQGRSAGVSIWAFLQTYGQLDKISPEFKQIVHANTATKVFFNILDTQSANESSELIGETEKIKTTKSQSRRKSISTPKIAIKPEGGTSDDGGTAETETIEEDFRVKPGELKKLMKGECLILNDGVHLAHIKVPLIKPNNDLAKSIGNTRLYHFKTPKVKGCDYFINSINYITRAGNAHPNLTKENKPKKANTNNLTIFES